MSKNPFCAPTDDRERRQPPLSPHFGKEYTGITYTADDQNNLRRPGSRTNRERRTNYHHSWTAVTRHNFDEPDLSRREKIMDYIAYLHKEKDSDYGVSFPDFPGCITVGRTLEEARGMAVEALALHIQGMIEDGIAVPESSKLEDPQGDPDLQHGIAVLVSAELPGKR
jgi:predicted RNase H-like HicB family nuclease